MTEFVIARVEVVALRFNVSDITRSIDRMRTNALRTRRLAEKAQAELDAKHAQQ